MDSTEIPVYGQQEQSAYNGHFESSCFTRCCCSIACLAAKLQMYGIFPDHRLLTIWPRFLLLGTWVSMLFLYAACV